jgi:hypothetical protein
MNSLAVPLTITQIEAAKRLHARLRQWQASDAALFALTEKFPGFAEESVLLKAVAVNRSKGRMACWAAGPRRRSSRYTAATVSAARSWHCLQANSPPGAVSGNPVDVERGSVQSHNEMTIPRDGQIRI